jgi:putative hydrolase of the HAD superfamily
MSRYRAIFFDVGETLVYAHPSAAEIMAEICAEAGLHVTPAEIEAADHRVWTRVQERQARAGAPLYSISPEASERFWLNVYCEILSELHLPSPARDPHRGLDQRVPAPRTARESTRSTSWDPLPLARRMHERFSSLETWRLFPDVLPALETIQARRRNGLVTAVISNWEDWLETLLVSLEVDRYFDFFVVSASVQLEKPDPAIFRYALDRAGVAPAEALHVGDSLSADVAGARAAGIVPLLLDRRGRYTSSQTGGATIIRTLAELPPLLD